MNMREIYENENREKQKLRTKLTQITILKWNLKLNEDRLGWNTVPNLRLFAGIKVILQNSENVIVRVQA